MHTLTEIYIRLALKWYELEETWRKRLKLIKKQTNKQKNQKAKQNKNKKQN